MAIHLSNKKATYFIGDIHGCLDELLQIEAIIKKHALSKGWLPFLVSVGDLIDRGPHSMEVVEHFRLGTIAGTHQAIMGNHESEFLRNLEARVPEIFAKKNTSFPVYISTMANEFDFNLRGSELYADIASYSEGMRRTWISQGGEETLNSYGFSNTNFATFDIPASHLDYLCRLPPFYEDEDGVASHGLVDPDNLLLAKNYAKKKIASEEMPAYRQLMFSLIWNRTPPYARVDHNRIHVSGHTPVEQPQLDEKLGFIQIDTGCVYGDRLCAFCPRSQDLFFVPSAVEWVHP